MWCRTMNTTGPAHVRKREATRPWYKTKRMLVRVIATTVVVRVARTC